MTASSEPRARKVVLPEVIGLHLRDAEIVLGNAGLRAIRVHYAEAYADPRTVVEQDPRPGQLIDNTREIRLTVARESLVGYLPQVYQQAAADGTSFLRGFLYIVQHVSDSVTDRVDRLAELFDPRTTDEEFLPWLASWLAISLNPDWDELQRRKMLLAATRLFPYRGTRRAIREFVRIYTGAEVTIEENAWPFNGFRIGVHSSIGVDAVILPPMNLAHCFVVRLDRAASSVTDDEIIKIHHIIQAQKPAHTSYFLAFRDEEEAGEMGVFIAVGAGAIGVEGEAGGGIGVGIGVVEATPEPEPTAEGAPKGAAKPAPEPAADEAAEAEKRRAEAEAEKAEREAARARAREERMKKVLARAAEEGADDAGGAPDADADEDEGDAAEGDAAEGDGGAKAGKAGGKRAKGKKKSGSKDDET